jgi:hypothetical protein
MKITKARIVSNSDVIKNYKTQRDKAELLGKLFIFKNNQPDAVLFSITEYERIADVLDAMDHMDEAELTRLIQSLYAHHQAHPKSGDPEPA